VTITAQTVKELREKTGCGFMDCKAALAENNGDLEASVDFLRKKGIASAAKKAHRETGEGLIVAHLAEDRRSGSLVEVNCETDFVARTDDFQSLVADLARQAAGTADTVTTAEELLAQPFINDVGQTVQDALNAAVGKIGENMRLRRFVRFAGEGEGVIEAYIHPGSKIGVLIDVSCDAALKEKDEFRTMVRDLAMQVAAAAPSFLREEDVPADVIAREKEVLLGQARESGKPENVLEKIVEGRIKKYFEDACLLNQKFVKDTDRTVQDIVQDAAAALGGEVAVRRFQRYQLGRD